MANPTYEQRPVSAGETLRTARAKTKLTCDFDEATIQEGERFCFYRLQPEGRDRYACMRCAIGMVNQWAREG